MSCMYKFYEYFPEAYDRYNISCWLDMQDSLIEEFGTSRLGFEVHLKNKSISIWRPEDKYTELNLCIDCVPYTWEYRMDGIIRVNGMIDFIFEHDKENNRINFVKVQNVDIKDELPFPDVEEVE